MKPLLLKVRYFKQQTNKPLTKVVNELRIQSACQRLLDSADDINLIAFRCGFRDVSYFNQVFKARKGLSPTKFRREFLVDVGPIRRCG